MDHLDSVRRSANMAKIRGKDTAPELRVRRVAHSLGLRFRLHRKDLPGCPDIVFPKYHLVVFVHGCFWHRHEGCKRATTPQVRRDFWEAKFAATVKRDVHQRNALRALGWQVLTVWECELKDEAALKARLALACEDVGRAPG